MCISLSFLSFCPFNYICALSLSVTHPALSTRIDQLESMGRSPASASAYPPCTRPLLAPFSAQHSPYRADAPLFRFQVDRGDDAHYPTALSAVNVCNFFDRGTGCIVREAGFIDRATPFNQMLGEKVKINPEPEPEPETKAEVE
jgi:hypothetical protein